MQAETFAWAYPIAYWTHLSLVTSSVSLFTARGCAVLMRRRWPMQAAWRRLSVAIDTALLGAGISLWTLLQFNPLRDHWLGAKLVLLLVYVVLGSFALKRAPTAAARAACLAAALACVAFIGSIALRHHPLGWWA